MTTLTQLRLALAEAKAELRLTEDDEKTTKALATMHVTGSNDDARKKAAIIALVESNDYQAALNRLRTWEATIDRLQAQIAVEEDTIRLAELRARERLAEALMGRRADDAVVDRCATFSRAPASDTAEWYGR